jgi:hypothetical protein
VNSLPWIEPRRPATLRQLTLAVTIGLHGLLLAAGWGPGPQVQGPPVVELPPLQVMLISERAGPGSSPQAVEQHAEDAGRPVPLPPPVVPPEFAPTTRQPDRPALPVTAPDLAQLAALPMPRAPIRLRLHIDASGRVGPVDVLESDPDDATFVQRLVEVLLATPHIPARRDGEDVASDKVVSLDFGPDR